MLIDLDMVLRPFKDYEDTLLDTLVNLIRLEQDERVMEKINRCEYHEPTKIEKDIFSSGCKVEAVMMYRKRFPNLRVLTVKKIFEHHTFSKGL